MDVLEFRDRLEQEFAARPEKNSRYSLRAFATFLGANHSTLSQILKGSRRVPASSIRSWARKLGMSREEAAVYVAPSTCPTQRLRRARRSFSTGLPEPGAS